MKLSPRVNLTFDGQCEAAFKFYAECMRGSISFMLTWGDSPMGKDAPPGWESKILHATLHLGDSVLHGADPLPGTYERPQGFSLTLGIDDENEAERIFNAMAADGGIVRVPLEKTFWAVRFGAVTDKYGLTWSINCEKPV